MVFFCNESKELTTGGTGPLFVTLKKFSPSFDAMKYLPLLTKLESLHIFQQKCTKVSSYTLFFSATKVNCKKKVDYLNQPLPVAIQKYWAWDGKWKAPWLHGQQLHYFQKWCFGHHGLSCRVLFLSSTFGWTNKNYWWTDHDWKSSPQRSKSHECCSWRVHSTSQLIEYPDAQFASWLFHKSQWLFRTESRKILFNIQLTFNFLFIFQHDEETRKL